MQHNTQRICACASLKCLPAEQATGNRLRHFSAEDEKGGGEVQSSGNQAAHENRQHRIRSISAALSGLCCHSCSPFTRYSLIARPSQSCVALSTTQVRQLRKFTLDCEVVGSHSHLLVIGHSH